MSWSLLGNSLLFSGLTAALAVALGLAAALALTGLGGAARAAGLVFTALPLVLPPFLAANCWLDLLGQTGAWRAWLPVNLYSLPAAAGVLALLLWPVTALLVSAAWQKLDPALFEADPRLRGAWLLRRLLLPAAAPALAPAAVLTFVLALNNFSVPALLQVKVFTVEIWLRFSTQYDVAGALLASLPVLAAPLGLLVWLRRREVPWPRWHSRLPAAGFRHSLGGGWFALALGLAGLAALLAVGLPLVRLVSDPRTWTQLPPALAAGRPALGATLVLSGLTAVLVVGLGLGLRRVPGGGVSWVLFFLPGVLVGVGLIALLNRPSLAWFYRGPAVIVLALVLRYLALGRQGARLAVEGVDRDLSDAARLFGARGWDWMRLVLWPQAAPTLAATAYLVYLLCLWDVETVVLLQPPGWETLALRVFNLLHYGHHPQVNALCLILLALAALPLLGWAAARSRGRGRRPSRAPPTRAAGAVVLALLLAGLAGGCAPAPTGETRLESRFFSHVEIIGEHGRGPGQFNKPRSLAVDRADNLYVADLTGRVQKFAPDGTYLLSWQMPETELGKAKGLGVDAAGNIIVLEPHYARVNHFTPQGQRVRQWGAAGTNAGQLTMPRAVAVNAAGEIWLCEYTARDRVQRFSPDGARALACFGRWGAGPGEFNRPEGLAVDAADRLYVADSCNHRVQVFAPDGTFLRAFGRPGTGPGELSYPYDLRVDAQGLVWVCEFGNSRLQAFDAEGRPVETLGGPGTAPGRFNNPWSLALDSRGNLYVADAGNHRVQKLVRREPASRTAARDNRPMGEGRLAADRPSGTRPGAAPPGTREPLNPLSPQP
jgi:ABC-type Fe3+ transport system permease subunit/DNA-binding beta-propeller fold protein YncE